MLKHENSELGLDQGWANFLAGGPHLPFRGWSRARACCLVQLHAIEEIALDHNFAKSSGSVVSQRAKSVVSLKKKKKVFTFSWTVTA